MEPAEMSLLFAGVALALSIGVAVRNEVRAGMAERLAKRADERAERAESRAEGAEAKAEELRLAQLWSDLVKQIQRWLNINVGSTDVGEPLTALRTAAVELVDSAPSDQWPGLGDWLGSEHLLGTLLGRSALERLPDGGAANDPDANLAAHRGLHLWALMFLTNVRRLRNLGPCDESREALELLSVAAEEQIAVVCKHHGWSLPEPPREIKPLRR
jgi:hypothetical protein